MCKWGKMSREHAPPFVALRQELEEHFHLFTVLLYVTHEHAEATELCDMVAFLEKGALHQVASPAEAYQNPKTLFVARSFSGFVNVVPGSLDAAGRFKPLGV